MFLFELWGINIDYKLILSFLIGIVVGAILLVLIYVILVLASLGSKKFLVKTDVDDLTLQEVKLLVTKAQEEYKDNSLRGSTTKFSHCINISKDLAYTIATRYYPNSKYPLLELSLDETIMLIGYIRVRLDDILDRKGVRLLKKFKISTIFDLSVKSNKVLQSKAFEVSKNVSKSVNAAKKVVNAINPAWWFRKTIIDTALSTILNKLYLIIITIVGEETYKIYSKKFINDDKEIEFDNDIDKIEESIKEDLINLEKDLGEDTLPLENVFSNNARLKQNVIVNTLDINNDYESIFNESMRLKQ